MSTDNPGSPNIQAGLAKYPVYTTLGGTFGFDQKFNRLEISAGATVDRTVYQNSTLTDGTTSTNDDRNFNQYGGVGRASYELTPAVKPFVEVEGDSRVHDLQIDRNGYARDSTGGYAKGGTSFEFSRLLTGEISVGWAARDYVDPRLGRLDGLLTAASLAWTATPLTTAKFVSSTSIDETIVPGVSGVLTHLYTVEVDHDFRRWLTAIGKFTYGTLDYQGDGRLRQDLLDRGRPGLQADPQSLDQGHAAPRHSQFQFPRLKLGLDRGDARGEGAELGGRYRGKLVDPIRN